MISGKNAAWEATGGVNEANICPKLPKIPNIYCYYLLLFSFTIFFSIVLYTANLLQQLTMVMKLPK